MTPVEPSEPSELHEIPPARVLAGTELPPRLLDLAPGPTRVRLWGAVPSGPVVAIVGSRSASTEGLARARAVAADLSRSGFVIASGGAEGIDEMAHRGALDAGAPTLVVAPAPLDAPYPKKLAGLFLEIVRRGGGYLTLNFGERVGSPGSFFERNGALVALSDLVLLGESRIDSGAMNALAAARRLGRSCFVLPCALELDTTRGSQHAVERLGAPMYFRMEQLVHALGVRGFANPDYLETVERLEADRARRSAEKRAKSRRRRARTEGDEGEFSGGRDTPAAAQTELPFDAAAPPDLDEDAGRVVLAIQRGARTAEQLVEGTGLAPERVSSLVIGLTLDGLVRQDERGLLRYDPRA